MEDSLRWISLFGGLRRLPCPTSSPSSPKAALLLHQDSTMHSSGGWNSLVSPCLSSTPLSVTGPRQSRDTPPSPGNPCRCALCLTQKATGSIRSFIAAALLALCACLRFRHLSQDLKLEAGFLKGTCRMGKRRGQRTRPPFDWAAPAVLPYGLDMASQVLLDYSELCRAFGKQPGFVLPDLKVAKGESLISASKRSLRELSLGRFIHLLRALLVGMGVPDVRACSFTSYSLRRFLPTAADALRFPEEARLAIGGWQEQPRTTPAQSQAMAQRYADDKTLTSGQIKKEVVVAISLASNLFPGNMTWDDLRQNEPTSEAIAAKIRRQLWQSKLQEKPPRQPRTTPSVSSSSSSSSSSSDPELEAEDSNHVSWFQQAPKQVWWAIASYHFAKTCPLTPCMLPEAQDCKALRRSALNARPEPPKPSRTPCLKTISMRALQHSTLPWQAYRCAGNA